MTTTSILAASLSAGNHEKLPPASLTRRWAAGRRILVSACLLGARVRFDGRAKPLCHAWLDCLRRQGRIILFCPEVAGGLPVPRPASEIQGGDGRDVWSGRARVVNRRGDLVSAQFRKGAGKALAVWHRSDACLAVLKDGSPSCGKTYIYDGSFTGQTIPGQGVSAALLSRCAVPIFSEKQLEEAASYLVHL
jgi:uncharacterized protein YbbK (DUF523 family)